MVYFEGTDVVGHVFGPYVPPRTACVPEAEFARYHRAVDEYYALVDKVLGQWMRRAEEDGATLVVNSDHGFRWGKDRPCEPPSLDLSGSWHRLEGVFVAWGARVRRSPDRGTASVFDVEPTIAALLDLPVDRRSSGKALRAAFPGIADPPRKDLVETVPVRRIAAEAISEKGASDYAQKLKSLGYLSGSEPAKLAPIGGDRPGLTEVGWNNLGVYLRDNTKDLAAAETALRKSIELAPGYATPQFNLALLYRTRGDGPKAIDWLFRSFQAGHAHPEGTILYWYVEYLDRGKTALARQLLERGAQAYPGKRGDRSRARPRPLQVEGLPGSLGRRGPLRVHDAVSRHSQRHGPLQDLPRPAPRGGRPLPAVSRDQARPTRRHPVAEGARRPGPGCGIGSANSPFGNQGEDK